MNNSDGSQLIPANLVAFAGFPTMLSQCFESLDNYDLEGSLMPWSIAEYPDKTPEKRNSSDKHFRSAIALLKNYVEVLSEYTKRILPDTNSKIDELLKEWHEVYEKNNYTDNEQSIALRTKADELRARHPDIAWLSEYQSEHSLDPDTFYSKEGFVFCGGAMITIGWLLMQAGIFNVRYFSKTLTKYLDGFMPLDNFAAWEPMFSVHRVDNSSFCKFSQFGQDVLGQEESKHWLVCDDEHDYMAESFTCFLSQGNIRDWMNMFEKWGYTRESAIEFFGVNGFFSNLFASINFSADFLHKENPSFTKVYIEGVVIPMFNEYFPAPILELTQATKTKKARAKKKKKT